MATRLKEQAEAIKAKEEANQIIMEKDYVGVACVRSYVFVYVCVCVRACVWLVRMHVYVGVLVYTFFEVM